MPLNKQDQDILQEIIKLDGNCLDPRRCDNCPFRSMCLPEFVLPDPPASPKQRKEMALKVLMHNELLDDGVDGENIKENYTWPTSEK